MTQITQTTRPAIPNAPRLFSVAMILAATIATGGAARYFSFSLESELLASLASMLLFSPACYAIVCLSWLVRPKFPQTALLLAAIAVGFGVWNAIMLPGLPDSEILAALSANAIHWLLFLLCGWGSLQLAQGILGIRIDPMASDPAPTSSFRGRLSVTKLLTLTAVCALLAEGARRFDLLAPDAVMIPNSNEPSESVSIGSPRNPVDTIHSAMIRSAIKKTMLAGALGGTLLGLQWPILYWLRTAGSFRTAGLILWIAWAAVVRWMLTIPLTRSNYEIHVSPYNSNFTIPPAQAFWLPDFAEGLQFLLEAVVQTGLVFLGFRLFTMLGLLIRFQSRHALHREGKAS